MLRRNTNTFYIYLEEKTRIKNHAYTIDYETLSNKFEILQQNSRDFTKVKDYI